MTSTSQQPKGRDGVNLTLDLVIQGLDFAKGSCSILPAQVALASASVLLTMIRDTMANDQDYVDLGRSCADVCQVLYRKLKGRRLDQLTQSVLDAIGNLTTTVAEIETKVVKQGRRNPFSRFVHARGDKDKIAGWKQDFVRVLHVFNTELAIDTNMVVAETHIVVAHTHTMISDIHRNVMTGQEGTSGKNHSAQTSSPLGELPPPAPRDCFGRSELIEKIVGLAENLEPVALIGTGGIGKTSIALTLLHHNRIKGRFGENRRFIRCDQFPASRAHFLARLSKAIGAGIENPEDLTPLRPFLSSKEIIIILDNAESILDPQGKNAEEIYSVVEELCHSETICLCITSRIRTVPPRCKRPEITMLSSDAACDIFYSIYNDCERSSIINDLLRRLDFHALSITLLATAASHNAWDYDRLTKEWDTKRAQVLQTDYNKSLAATIELSLASPTFQSLGPNARDLLGVVAFFPQGIHEKNMDWLLQTMSNGNHIFDKFCALSLTYRSNGFIVMLAPIRDYLGPRDPRSSPLLCTTRDHYLTRLSVDVDPEKPKKFKESQWIVLEDLNVEHLLDVFTSIDPDGSDIWEACIHFMRHLHWHKPRRTILGLKVEALADDHYFKSSFLFEVSRLFGRLGNYAEQKRLLTDTLKLNRQRGDGRWVAETLRYLSDVSRLLGLYEEGILQVKEALGIYEQINDTKGRTRCLKDLAFLLFCDEQLDAAESAGSRAIILIPDKGQEFLLCDLHLVLGRIYRSKQDKKKAIHHFETAIGIASPPNWHDPLFLAHFELAQLFCGENEFEDANAHIERAKPYIVANALMLCRAMEIQALVWYRQGRLEDAKSEAFRALELHEKCGAAHEAGICRGFLQRVEREITKSTA